MPTPRLACLNLKLPNINSPPVSVSTLHLPEYVRKDHATTISSRYLPSILLHLASTRQTDPKGPSIESVWNVHRLQSKDAGTLLGPGMYCRCLKSYQSSGSILKKVGTMSDTSNIPQRDTGTFAGPCGTIRPHGPFGPLGESWRVEEKLRRPHNLDQQQHLRLRTTGGQQCRRLQGILCLSIYICQTICQSTYLSIYLSIYLFICLSILSSNLSVYLPIYLSGCLSIYLSIYLCHGCVYSR